MTAIWLPAVLGVLLGQAAPAEGPPLPRVVGREIKEPRKVKSVAPKYPEDARRAGLDGPVILECTLGPEGDVQKIAVQDGPRVLSDAAVKAVRQWRYTPTLLDGAAVPVIMTVTVNFKMDTVSYDDLMSSLRHRDEAIRAAAARNLAALRSRSSSVTTQTQDAIVKLQEIAERDPSATVRAAAAATLSALEGKPLPAPASPETPAPPSAVPGAESAAAGAQQDFDAPPRVRRQARPEYPRDAFEARIQGTVLVEALVDVKGRIAKARVIQSVPGLDEAALKAAKKWQFHPAMKGGRPVATIIHMPVKFKIE